MPAYSTCVLLQSLYDDNDVDDFDITDIPRITTGIPVITGCYISINSLFCI